MYTGHYSILGMYVCMYVWGWGVWKGAYTPPKYRGVAPIYFEKVRASLRTPHPP